MPRHRVGERFEVVLEAAPSDVPPAVRLRGLLKLALRAFGLRCTSCRDVTPAPAPPPPAYPPPGEMGLPCPPVGGHDQGADR
jgi:hypothetical protein